VVDGEDGDSVADVTHENVVDGESGVHLLHLGIRLRKDKLEEKTSSSPLKEEKVT